MQKKTFRLRKGVDPIIATLLLIAIAVAAGVIVYVYVNSVAGSLTQGGGQQVSDQLSMDAYSFTAGAPGTLTVYIRDTGGSAVTIDSAALYVDGLKTADGSSNVAGACTHISYALTTTGQCYLTFSITANSGTTHTVKVLDQTGGTFVFSVTAGRSG